MRPLVLLFLIVAPVFGDAPACNLNNSPLVAGPGAAQDNFRVQVADFGNTGTLYSVSLYADDSSMTSTTDVLSGSNTSTVVFAIPNGPWGTGMINLKDGNRHHVWAKITNSASFPGGVPCISGNGMPYKWNVANGVIDMLYDLYNSFYSAGATPQNIALVANLNDLYSTGQSAGGGNLQYMVNGNSIFDNGVVGYYGKVYGVPLAHVHVLPLAVTGTVTKAAMDTAFAAMTPAFGSDEQYIGVGWMTPYRISGLVATGDAGTVTPGAVIMSVTAFFTFGGGTSFTSIVGGSPQVLWQGQSDTANGMFLTTSKTPFTDYGQRYAFQLAWALCSSGCGTSMTGTWTASFATAKTAIDASAAARNMNPTGGNIVMTSNSGDLLRSSNYLNSSTLGYNTSTVTPASLNITTSNTPVNRTFSATGLTGYSFSDQLVNTASAPVFQSGTGYGIDTTSNAGILDGVGSGQTPAIYWVSYAGAAWSCGTVTEPYGLLPQEYPDVFLQMSGYTRGMTAIEAASHSIRDLAKTVCVGDPLNHSFGSGNSGGSSFSGGSISGGVITR